MYKTGYDFFEDLVRQFGRQDAIAVANRYLDMQRYTTDAEEDAFCRQLYRATQAAA